MAFSTVLISPPILSGDLRQFAEDKVNLPTEIATARRQKVADLRDRLDKWMVEHPECGLSKSLLSGSLAKGTALKNSSDIDVALYLTYDGPRKADRQLSEWMADRLRRAYPQMNAEQIEPQEYSVKITYKELGIDVDIVPVFCNGESGDFGWLVSKRTGRQMLTNIPLHLAFIRKRKTLQTPHFAQTVRLLKWWSSLQKGADAEFRFKSFMVELICAHLADNGQDFADYCVGAEAFFNYIVGTRLKQRIVFEDYYQADSVPPSTDPIQIFDPVNAKNNVASQYTEQHRQLILTAAADGLDAINEAHTAATKGHAVSMWQVVLGTSFRG